MGTNKAGEPLLQDSYTSKNDQPWSQEERKALTDLFMIFYEIDQQSNVTKGDPDGESNFMISDVKF